MKQIFINLPATDLARSMDFYSKIGFTNKPLFSDDEQKCMVWSEAIYVMLMTYKKFETYSRKAIPDTKNHVAAYYTLPVEGLNTIHFILEKV